MRYATEVLCRLVVVKGRQTLNDTAYRNEKIALPACISPGTYDRHQEQGIYPFFVTTLCILLFSLSKPGFIPGHFQDKISKPKLLLAMNELLPGKNQRRFISITEDLKKCIYD